MVQIVMSVKNTFVQFDVDFPDFVEMGSNARKRTSSIPARMKFASTEDANYNAQMAWSHGLEEFPLLPPHDEDDYTCMHTHPGPSPLDMDVEEMLGYSEPETDSDDHCPGLSFSQPKDEITSNFADVGTEGGGTLSGETKDYSASARAYQGLTHGPQLPDGHYRESLAQALPCRGAAPITPHQPAQRSTFPIPPREEQRDSYMQSYSWNSSAGVHHNAPNEETQGQEERTTVMLMNVPRGYTSSRLMRTIDSEGFACMYDFIYVPMAAARTSKGYAFVNFVNPSIAQHFESAFNGFYRWSTASKNVCNVVWATKHQGLQANVDHYRKSTVLGKSVPGEFKPRIFQNGVEVPFPHPIRKSSTPTRGVEQPRTSNSQEAVSL